jgi:alpha-L-fucosidase 2
LHYDRPAEYFDEALPIGNGRLGAMVYGGTSSDRLSLNDITLWSGEPDRGKGHHDFTYAEHLTPWGEAASWTGRIREALESEDYAKADSLQKKIQGHYSESYQPLGTLWIDYPEGDRITGYSRELDISDATATVSYLRSGKRFKAEYLVSSPDSAIVIHLSGEAPVDAVIRLDSQQPHTIKTEDGLLICDGYTAYHTYPGYYDTKEHMLYDQERGIHFRTVVSCKDGMAEDDGSLRISGVNETLIIISNSTSFNGFDKDPVTEGREYKESARLNASEAAAKGWDALRIRHVRDYRRYFDRVAIDLGETPDDIKSLPTDIQLLRYADGEANPELEALYFQYGRYLLISSSRTPGIPANLQGLWNESIDPPWSCNYTTNINLEENYWAAESAALPEMHASLLGFLHNLSATGELSAKNYYGIDRGWCLGHNTDVWAMTCPVGLGTGDPKWDNWTFGGAWLSTHIWEHWLFSRNIDDLRRDYPVLKGAALFCMDYLVEKDGELIPSPSTSPENDYITDSGYVGSTLYGSTCDISIIRECIADALSAAEVLGDLQFAEEAARILPRLRGFRIGSDGALQEWYHDWRDKDPYHRHQSHLFGVYPGHQIGPEGKLAEAAMKSLEIKGFETTGWSCGWGVNLYARLGDAENSYRMFRRLLRYVSPDGYQGADARRGGGTYPNLLDAHSPFQIDGNFGGCAGIIEMLVQSDAEDVRLLPALPSAWPEGSIRGIRTRTGKIVDIRWKDGKVIDSKIR